MRMRQVQKGEEIWKNKIGVARERRDIRRQPIVMVYILLLR